MFNEPDLFSVEAPQPLAASLRPQRLEDVLGQSHLIAPGKPLHSAYTQKTPHSFILWGPPGVGKTTLALMAGLYFDLPVISLNAVNAGAKDVRDALDQARQTIRLHQKQAIIFLDEIHRLSRANQDALLGDLERGMFFLIGATTESPTHELTSALLSRARVYRLSPLSDADIEPILVKATSKLKSPISFTSEARRALISRSQGDARALLNNVEIILASAQAQGVTEVDEPYLDGVTGDTVQRFGKFNSDFYSTISALHKSIRGSDPDAALYWLARMLRGGADPLYVGRRLMVMASEDIGLADPRAVAIASAAVTAFKGVGMPEGGIIYANLVCYLALAPKSNDAYMAWNRVNKYLDGNPAGEVPLHLEDGGPGYRYSHQEPGAISPGQQYLPDTVGKEFWLWPDVHRPLQEKAAYAARRQDVPPLSTRTEHINQLARLRAIDIWGQDDGKP